MSIMSLKTLELVWVKAKLNLKSEASINYLSYAWWIIEPVLQMAIYYLVFAYLLKQGGHDYVPFLLTGLIPGYGLVAALVMRKGVSFKEST